MQFPRFVFLHESIWHMLGIGWSRNENERTGEKGEKRVKKVAFLIAF